jgi:hypothetical protein
MDASFCLACGADSTGKLSLAEGLKACIDEHVWNREVGLRLYNLAQFHEAELMQARAIPIWCFYAFGRPAQRLRFDGARSLNLICGKAMKIAICIPHTGSIRAACAESLNRLVAHTASARVNYNGAITQPKFEFFYEAAGPLEYKRTRLAHRALEWGADYHLLIDWDHTFPPDALVRLAKHDLPFVAANYPTRHGSRQETALADQGVPATGKGLQEVAAVGLGFALIKPKVFAMTPRPWFASRIDENGELRCGEDIHFCNHVRAAGLPIHVDHDLVVGHIAEVVLTLEGGANAVSAVASSGAQ